MRKLKFPILVSMLLLSCTLLVGCNRNDKNNTNDMVEKSTVETRPEEPSSAPANTDNNVNAGQGGNEATTNEGIISDTGDAVGGAVEDAGNAVGDVVKDTADGVDNIANDITGNGTTNTDNTKTE
ncbi:MAG: hypothetical protein PHE02_04785 [Lachnospiraceae bacterium]|nr:hypothetical protein [Lachnospiraceae bacterium]